MSKVGPPPDPRRRIVAGMSIHETSIGALTGGSANLGQYRGKVLLIINTASECGLTPQYAGLQKLADEYADRGLVVLGVPCNQFGGQEPGTAEEIGSFCTRNYGVTFPLTEKIEVNGPGRHPLYEQLVGFPDSSGAAGDIQWNFEKFLVGRDGTVAARFRPGTEPSAPEVIEAIDRLLAA
jgi:glutathione peroxidase